MIYLLNVHKLYSVGLVMAMLLLGYKDAFTGEEKRLQVDGLMCEYRFNPQGIDVVSPRLSWVVSSSQRGQRQTAYQVQVASSPAVLQARSGDLWDSGKVSSAQTLHISYQGLSLTSYQRCWWSVRVWDKNELVSAWSVGRSWSMGILSEKQWGGKWLGFSKRYTFQGKENIALKESWKQVAPSPMFRKTFTLKKDISHAALYICGLGFYEAYLNGTKVGDHVLDPAFTRYDRACLYVTHDVTTLVRKGRNAIGVMLGNGWYNVFSRAAWGFDHAPWRDQPKMLAQLRVEYSDGSTELIVSDRSWKAATGPILMDGIRQGEYYDARLEMAGWNTADFNDIGWCNSELVEAPLGSLRAQMLPAIKVTATLPAIKLTEPQKGFFVFDLGQNMAGWAQLRVSGPGGTKVRLRYGERLDKDGLVDQQQIKAHTYEEVFHTDTYVMKGAGLEVWEPRFAYYGFRYVEVSGYPGSLSIESIVGRAVNTAFDQVGRFHSSSDLLNRIQRCALWAYRSNFQGYPTDCPHREKNGWMADAHLAVEQAMYNWANGGGYTKWLLDIKDEQRESGELPGIIPTGGWGYEWGNGPAWDSAYLIVPWEMYRYYGDKRIIETHFERFKRYVDYLTSRAENHIITFGLDDWAAVKTKTPIAVTSTGYYYIDALIVARVAEILGYESDMKKYSILAGEIKKAYNERFYKGDGIYSGGSQTALCFPLYCGLVPSGERAKVVSNLVRNIRDNGNHIDTGILGAKAIFNVLSENGEHKVAYQMISQPTAPGYRDWIKQGATTLWESWEGVGSQNHIMYGDISAWFYKNLAGINVCLQSTGHEAFKTFVLRPRLVDDLTSVTASFESIRGTIGSAWTFKDNRFEWRVQIPTNTTAMVYVPAKSPEVVTESGQSIGSVEEIIFVKFENGYSVYNVQSGIYTFESDTHLAAM